MMTDKQVFAAMLRAEDAHLNPGHCNWQGIAHDLMMALRVVLKQCDCARENARVLAHSYDRDSTPPSDVVRKALSYSVVGRLASYPGLLREEPPAASAPAGAPPPLPWILRGDAEVADPHDDSATVHGFLFTSPGNLFGGMPVMMPDKATGYETKEAAYAAAMHAVAIRHTYVGVSRWRLLQIVHRDAPWAFAGPDDTVSPPSPIPSNPAAKKQGPSWESELRLMFESFLAELTRLARKTKEGAP
jgi:hypothetical protein